MTDTSRLATKIGRKQREQARKQKGSVRHRRVGGQLQSKQKRIRANDTHHISRELADRAHTIVVEDLNTAGMTQSAEGTVAEPGRNVKAKAGLNRVILGDQLASVVFALALQVRPSHAGGPEAYESDLPPMRLRRPMESDIPSSLPLCLLWPSPACRLECGGPPRPAMVATVHRAILCLDLP